jgi:hydrogenase maturation protease
MSSGPQTVSVLLCGEPLRGDDAVASAVAEGLDQVVGERASIRWVGGLAVDDLLDLPAGAPCVIVDAVAGVPGGELVVRPLERLGGPASQPVVSGHRVPIRDVIALARQLGWSPVGTFVGVGGERFGLGEPMSGSVIAAVPSLRAAIAREVARLGGATAPFERAGAR